MDAISSMDFDYVASGHYANVVHSSTKQMEDPSVLELSHDMVLRIDIIAEFWLFLYFVPKVLLLFGMADAFMESVLVNVKKEIDSISGFYIVLTWYSDIFDMFLGIWKVCYRHSTNCWYL